MALCRSFWARMRTCATNSSANQDFDQGIELRTAVLARNHETKIPARWSAWIFDERRINGRCEQIPAQSSGFTRAAGKQRHNRPGRFIERQASRAQRLAWVPPTVLPHDAPRVLKESLTILSATFGFTFSKCTKNGMSVHRPAWPAAWQHTRFTPPSPDPNCFPQALTSALPHQKGCACPRNPRPAPTASSQTIQGLKPPPRCF